MVRNQTLFALPAGNDTATIKATVISATAITNSLSNSIESILLTFRHGQVRWLHQRKNCRTGQNDRYDEGGDDGGGVVAHE